MLPGRSAENQKVHPSTMTANLSDTPPPARDASWKWWVCGLLLLATMLNYMDRLTLNLTAKRIMEEFGLNALDYGYLEKYFGYAFGLGAIAFGWTVDRWNVRWIYPIAVLLWSAAGFATGLVQGFTGLLILRFLLGLAEAGHWPCALRTTQRVLPESERSMGNSMLQSGAAFGAILTPLIVMVLIYYTGSWRMPFLVIGALGVGWVALWLRYMGGQDLALTGAPSSTSLAVVLVPLVLLLGLDIVAHLPADLLVPWLGPLGLEALALQLANKETGLALLVTVGVTAVGTVLVIRWLLRATKDDRHLPRALFIRRFGVLLTVVVTINATWHFFRAWMPLFLQKQHFYQESTVYWFSMAYYAISDVGCLLAGYLTLRLIRGGLPIHTGRLLVFAGCALLCCLSVVAAFLPAGPWLLALFLAIGFGALGLFPNYYSFSQELTVHAQGKVTGSLGCITWIVSALMHEVVGASVESTGSYSYGIAVAGLLPLLPVVALALFWGTTTPAPAPVAEKTALTV